MNDHILKIECTICYGSFKTPGIFDWDFLLRPSNLSYNEDSDSLH